MGDTIDEGNDWHRPWIRCHHDSAEFGIALIERAVAHLTSSTATDEGVEFLQLLEVVPA